MTNVIKNWVKIVPGVAIALIIAVVATVIESILPIHIIGTSVIALFIGIIINCIVKPSTLVTKGLKFTSKRLLKVAIILLGSSLSVSMILQVGASSLVVMCFTLATCFGIGFIVGRLLKLNWKTSNLISAGTGICGGSAIAALSPVIEADDNDIAIAMSATFLFDMIMIVIFPIMGRALGLSDMGFGLWAGTAVNDTSSVVATGLAFSDAACEYATMVKLTRTLSIIPVVIVFAIINSVIKKKEYNKMVAAQEISGQCEENSIINDENLSNQKPKMNLLKIFPWFIFGFLALAVLNSVGVIPSSVSDTFSTISKFMFVMALAAIGLNTNIKDMKKAGIRPMLHGFIISALVVVVAISVQFMLGLV